MKTTAGKRNLISNAPSLRARTPDKTNADEEEPARKKRDKSTYPLLRPWLKKLMEPDFFFPLEPLCPPQNGYLTPEPTVISLMTIRYSPASTPMSEELWPT